MSQCWVIGDTAVDLLSDGDQFIRFPGGTGANISVALSRLGIENSLVTKLGNDPLATFLMDTLVNEKVGTQNVSFSADHRTSLIAVSLDDRGDRSFTFMVRPSADSQLEIRDFPRFERGDWVCVSAFILARQPSRAATLTAITQARTAGSFVCIDANMRAEVWDDKSLLVPETLEALKTADVAKMSEEEMLLLTNKVSFQQGVDELKKWPAKIKIITRAAKGAVLVVEQSEYCVEGYSVPVLDMTGAGDAFFAAFISQLIPLQHWSHERLVAAVEFSNACGSLVVQQKGAMSALPELEMVNKFIMGEGKHVEVTK